MSSEIVREEFKKILRWKRIAVRNSCLRTRLRLVYVREARGRGRPSRIAPRDATGRGSGEGAVVQTTIQLVSSCENHRLAVPHDRSSLTINESRVCPGGGYPIVREADISRDPFLFEIEREEVRIIAVFLGQLQRATILKNIIINHPACTRNSGV